MQVEPKALQLLVFLVENRGRLVEKGELLNAIWNGAFVTENVLPRAITQLRKVLADDAKNARYIETVPTRGYRFVAEVEVQDDLGQSQVVAPAVPATVTPEPQTGFQRMAPARKLIYVLTGLVLAAVVGLIVLRRQHLAKDLEVLNSTQITTSTGMSMYPSFSPDGNAMA